MGNQAISFSFKYPYLNLKVKIKHISDRYQCIERPSTNEFSVLNIGCLPANSLHMASGSSLLFQEFCEQGHGFLVREV